MRSDPACVPVINKTVKKMWLGKLTDPASQYLGLVI